MEWHKTNDISLQNIIPFLYALSPVLDRFYLYLHCDWYKCNNQKKKTWDNLYVIYSVYIWAAMEYAINAKRAKKKNLNYYTSFVKEIKKYAIKTNKQHHIHKKRGQSIFICCKPRFFFGSWFLKFYQFIQFNWNMRRALANNGLKMNGKRNMCQICDDVEI